MTSMTVRANGTVRSTNTWGFALSISETNWRLDTLDLGIVDGLKPGDPRSSVATDGIDVFRLVRVPVYTTNLINHPDYTNIQRALISTNIYGHVNQGRMPSVALFIERAILYSFLLGGNIDGKTNRVDTIQGFYPGQEHLTMVVQRVKSNELHNIPTFGSTVNIFYPTNILIKTKKGEMRKMTLNSDLSMLAHSIRITKTTKINERVYPTSYVVDSYGVNWVADRLYLRNRLKIDTTNCNVIDGILELLPSYQGVAKMQDERLKTVQPVQYEMIDGKWLSRTNEEWKMFLVQAHKKHYKEFLKHIEKGKEKSGIVRALFFLIVVVCGIIVLLTYRKLMNRKFVG